MTGLAHWAHLSNGLTSSTLMAVKTDNVMDAVKTNTGDVTIIMTTDQARALRDYLDTIDHDTITGEAAADFSNTLGRLAGALGRVYPY